MDSERIVIVAGVAAGGLKLASDYRKNGRTPENVRVMVGTCLLVAVLLLIANFWPDGARVLAVAILVTSIAMNGGDFFALLAGLVK